MSEADGPGEDIAEDGGGDPSCWVGYFADRHGRPRAEGNDHLSPEQRRDLEQAAADRAARRGRHRATVVVHVYENGEAVPQVQFPKESDLDPSDRSRVNEVVGQAAEALRNWS